MRPIGELSYKNALLMHQLRFSSAGNFLRVFMPPQTASLRQKKLKKREKVWTNTLSERKPYDIIMKKLKEQENG